jgi:hypothetical protein
LWNTRDELCFMAIKTRNPEYGPWRLRDLCITGGALRSLLRTHRAIEEIHDPRKVVLQARLEGPLRRGDAVQELSPPREGPASPQLVSDCAHLLDEEETVIEPFLERVQVVARMPPRDVIQEKNMSFLRSVAGGMSADGLLAVYEAAIALLEAAMSAELLDAAWPLAHPHSRSWMRFRCVESSNWKAASGP